jgi:hypothetical protein
VHRLEDELALGGEAKAASAQLFGERDGCGHTPIVGAGTLRGCRSNG